MKSKKIVTCLSTLLAVSLIATGCGKEIEVKNGSKVAISVKGEQFTATEYYEKIKETNISTLVDMIDKSILEKKYKDKKDEEDKEVKNQIDQIKSVYGSDETTYSNVLRSYFGVESEEELEENLRLQYKRSEAVKDYIKDNLKKDEIKKYYEDNIYGQVSASHILISVDVDSKASDTEKDEAEKKAEEKAKEIIEKLNNGEDFKKLAKENSSDSANASKGGDLGYFDLDEMVTEFSDAVKNLKVDEYTKEPVKTEHGYHIILKTGEKEKPKQSEVEDKIKEALTTEKLNNTSSLYYETLIDIRKDNNIKWNDTELEKAYNDYNQRLIDSTQSNQ